VVLFTVRIGAIAAALLGVVRVEAGPLDPGARLCLQRPGLPIENASTDPRTADLEARLTKALRDAGYAIPEPASVNAALERAVEPLPGSVDPHTGRRDAARYAARQGAIGQALRELDCDARVLAEVVPVWAFFNNGFVKWDGRNQRVSTSGRIWLNVLGGVQEFGHVRAFSLWLRVLDLEGNEIAFRSAGIESIVQLSASNDGSPRPPEQWLTATKRLDSAIRSALGEQAERLRDPKRSHPEASLAN